MHCIRTQCWKWFIFISENNNTFFYSFTNAIMTTPVICSLHCYTSVQTNFFIPNEGTLWLDSPSDSDSCQKNCQQKNEGNNKNDTFTKGNSAHFEEHYIYIYMFQNNFYLDERNVNHKIKMTPNTYLKPIFKRYHDNLR